MHTEDITVVVVGADTRDGMRWLHRRFPDAPRHGRVIVLLRPGGELDGVLWAEPLRAEARRVGVRLSIGLAELRRDLDLHDVTDAAAAAYRRAFDIGGDLTVTASALVQRAA